MRASAVPLAEEPADGVGVDLWLEEGADERRKGRCSLRSNDSSRGAISRAGDPRRDVGAPCTLLEVPDLLEMGGLEAGASP
jgi:hypothetical protein